MYIDVYLYIADLTKYDNLINGFGALTTKNCKQQSMYFFRESNITPLTVVAPYLNSFSSADGLAKSVNSKPHR